MTEPKTAEQYAVAMQRDNSLTPMQWIRKAMLQAWVEACDKSRNIVIGRAGVQDNCACYFCESGRNMIALRDSKREENF